MRYGGLRASISPAHLLRAWAIAVLQMTLYGCGTAGISGRDAALSALEVFRECAECPQMVAVPPGEFTMGSPPHEDRWEGGREDPQHKVSISKGFALGRFEVTRAQYDSFVADTNRPDAPCAVWDRGQWLAEPSRNWREPGFGQDQGHPVVCVSWNDALAYTQWLTRKTGKAYRLPSEAEWEYAARAGTLTARHWGEDAAGGCAFANQGDQSLRAALGLDGVADCDDRRVYTAPAGSYLPNPWGLFDMLGNAWEWTHDCWNPGYNGAPEDGSAWTVGDCSLRVPRGGSWNSHQRNVRSANRGTYRADIGFFHIGFRLARDR